jgi:tRNA 2-thiocytidine biosynthesis protein TtcA
LDPTHREAFERKKRLKRLYRLVGSAIVDYQMIEDGDLVMVGVSGGKDSYALLDILLRLQKRAPIRFDLVAVHIDSGFPGHQVDLVENHLIAMGVKHLIEHQNLFSLIQEKISEKSTPCSLCARLRRGVLYRLAKSLKVTKIALGHHLDDAIETLFLNLFHGGKIKSMPPKLLSDDGCHILIRPMAYCRETDLIAYRDDRHFPITKNDYCDRIDNLQRQKIKALLRQWEKQHPGRMASITHALSDIVPSHLYDRNHFDFSLPRRDDEPVAPDKSA